MGKEKVWVGTAENYLSTVFLSSDFRAMQLSSKIFQIEAHAEITSYRDKSVDISNSLTPKLI